MKNILFIVLTFVSLTLMAQVPQGVGYQGVATDANGIELVNQSISIRASVLSGSANGTIEWEETHSTSTDTFGLFNLTIGQGNNTGNGLQVNFADISWGTNTHFLKIEMDATGGNDFSFMGTNQMMSVPYALYAESANINYDSISNLLSNDSTFINTLSITGNMVFGDFIDLTNILNLNEISFQYFTSDTIRFNEDGFLYFNTNSFAGQTTGSVWATISSDSLLNSPIMNFGSGNVNEGVVIPIKKDSYVNLMGNGAYWTYPKWLPIINESEGLNTTSTLDSTTVANMIASASSGCNLQFPDGLNGEGIYWDLSNGNDYTIPEGKNLFITNLIATYGYHFNIDGKRLFDNSPIGYPNLAINLPISVGSGQTISYDHINLESATFYGILTNSIVEPISFNFDNIGSDNEDYLVPIEKKLIINNLWLYGNDISLKINNNIVYTGNSNSNFESLNHYSLKVPLIVNGGSLLATYDNLSGFNGYLVDEDFFSDCGGGGGSSNNESGNYSPLSGAVSQCGDTIYSSDGYLIIPGSSQANLQTHFPVGSVEDIDGNIYKTAKYGDKEWMVENLKTNLGDYEIQLLSDEEENSGYVDSIGYYYSYSSLDDICPYGWHVPTLIEWQELHSEIFCSNNMNPNGYTNSLQAYNDNNYKILWSNSEGGTNQSGFNLYNTGHWSNADNYFTNTTGYASFWTNTNESCLSAGAKLIKITSEETSNDYSWSLDVGCSSISNVKAQIRCVKD